MVAGDTTSNGNLIGYANMLSGKGLLRRVVVDECHLIITSSDWRPKLALLKNLRLLPCPIVLLRYMPVSPEGSVQFTANHRRRSIKSLPSVSPHQNLRLLPLL
jgi:hypothetical protein